MPEQGEGRVSLSPSSAGCRWGTAADWAEQAHKAAQTVWKLVPANKQLDDSYYTQVLPILIVSLAWLAFALPAS
jgi:hypothetical protein